MSSTEVRGVGYQLVFWKQEEVGPPASEVYEALMERSSPASLRPLPINSILTALCEELRGLEISNGAQTQQPVFFEFDDEQTVVELSWSSLHVSAELRPAGNWSRTAANQVIDVILDFGCALYDPQTNERFS